MFPISKASLSLFCGLLCSVAGMAQATEQKAAQNTAQNTAQTATQPTPGASVTVYAAGDIADCRYGPGPVYPVAKTADLLFPLLQQDSAARVLALGDNAYQKGSLAEYNHCYQPTWGKFKDRTHPSPGNHEYQTPDAQGYFDYFGAAAGPDKRGYYRVQLGAWQVYSLNSNLKDLAQQQQLAWLKQELASNPARCTLAYWHHPMFSSGPHGNSKSKNVPELWNLLAAAKVDLILNGHDHHYERFAAQDANGQSDSADGMVQFVVGTGGSGLYEMKALKKNSKAAQDKELGVLKLVLKEDGFDWQFLPVAGGSFADSGSQACH